MKSIVVFLSLAAFVTARPEPPVSYGAPSYQSSAPVYGAPAPQQIVHRHVYVHAAPDEITPTETKIIRAGGNPEKHVNIIFVKAPSHSSQSLTEVQLPEQPQQKTLVYVLVKKPESSNSVQVRGPAPTKPSKPEVYFIRYKDQAPVYGPPAAQYGAPVAAAPQGGYGAPARGGY